LAIKTRATFTLCGLKIWSNMSDERANKFKQDFRERERNLAYYLRLDVNEAKQKVEVAGRDWIADAKEDLRFAQKERVVFWKKTFRDVDPRVEDFNEQQIRLYLNWGYLFKTPANKIIQDLLDTLDAYSPTWDHDKPEFFYEVLVSNFPDLTVANPPIEEILRKREILDKNFPGQVCQN
jgi:hypothetical protein